MKTCTTPNAAQALPSGAVRARQIARTFADIADTTRWPHAQWQALLARLSATGKPTDEITLADIAQAIAAQREAQQVAA